MHYFFQTYEKMISHELSFDFDKPYGSNGDAQVWSLVNSSDRRVEFHCKTSSGYDLSVWLKPINPDARTFALALGGMEFEYGYNAVGLHFEQTGADPVSIKSQFFAHWESCVVTCVLQATYVEVYVESGLHFDERVRLYKDAQLAFEDDSGKIYKHKLKLDPELRMPSVRVSLMHKNHVTIVPADKTRAFQQFCK